MCAVKQLTTELFIVILICVRIWIKIIHSVHLVVIVYHYCECFHVSSKAQKNSSGLTRIWFSQEYCSPNGWLFYMSRVFSFAKHNGYNPTMSTLSPDSDLNEARYEGPLEVTLTFGENPLGRVFGVLYWRLFMRIFILKLLSGRETWLSKVEPSHDNIIRFLDVNWRVQRHTHRHRPFLILTGFQGSKVAQATHPDAP